jgi:hypothetical protein
VTSITSRRTLGNLPVTVNESRRTQQMVVVQLVREPPLPTAVTDLSRGERWRRNDRVAEFTALLVP